MKLLALAALLIGAVIACKAMLPDYVGVSVSQPLGDGSSIDGGDGHGMFGTGGGSLDAQTYIGLMIGYSPGERSRHKSLMKEIERSWKKQVAAQDRAQIAFLTKTLVADKGNVDLLGDPVGPDLSNPVDVLVKVVPEVPETFEQLLLLFGWAVVVLMLSAAFYFLRKQHIARKRCPDPPTDSSDP